MNIQEVKGPGGNNVSYMAQEMHMNPSIFQRFADNKPNIGTLQQAIAF